MLLLLMVQLEKIGFITRHKYDVFATFKKWKYLVENETGKILKCLDLIMEVNTKKRSFIVTMRIVSQ